MFRSKNKEGIYNYFLDKYWLDPRRAFKNKQIEQVFVNHYLQNDRPLSSFKSRITLASKHLIIDTYLMVIFLFIILLPNSYNLFLGITLTVIIQRLIKFKVGKRE